jgi:hypothetical protein
MLGPLHVLNYTDIKRKRTIVKYGIHYADTTDFTHIYAEMLALEQNNR